MVLPVPVAPVIKPWRLARSGQQFGNGVAVAGEEDGGGHGLQSGV